MKNISDIPFELINVILSYSKVCDILNFCKTNKLNKTHCNYIFKKFIENKLEQKIYISDEQIFSVINKLCNTNDIDIPIFIFRNSKYAKNNDESTVLMMMYAFLYKNMGHNRFHHILGSLSNCIKNNNKVLFNYLIKCFGIIPPVEDFEIYYPFHNIIEELFIGSHALKEKAIEFLVEENADVDIDYWMNN